MSCTISRPFTGGTFLPTNPHSQELESAIFNSNKVRALFTDPTYDYIFINVFENPNGEQNLRMSICDLSGNILEDSPSLTARFPCPDDCSIHNKLSNPPLIPISCIFCISHVEEVLDQDFDFNGIAFHLFLDNNNAEKLAMYAVKSWNRLQHTRFNDYTSPINHLVFQAN